MSAPPEVLETVREWVAKAEDDLHVADLALQDRRFRAYGVTCFLAQQCAEKYIKALLAFHSIPFRRTHDLRELLALLPPAGDLQLAADRVDTLTSYAIDPRYPGARPPIEEPEAEAAVSTAREIRDGVRGRLPQEALPKSRPRGHAGK